MSLHKIHGGPGASMPPWAEKDEKELRETFEEAMRDGEHVVVVYVHRMPDEKTKTAWCRNRRGTRSSWLEMAGVVHRMLVDWLKEDA